MADTGLTPYGASTGTAAGGVAFNAHQPIWDTSEFNQTTLSILFFQLNQGQALPISAIRKDKTHTNMTLAGQLPAGLSFKVQAIRLKLVDEITGMGGAAADAIQQRLRVFAGSLVEFKLLDKIVFSIPAVFCNPGAGVEFFTSEAASSVQKGQLGSKDASSIMLLQEPIIIAANQNFQVEMTLPALIAQLTVAHQIVCLLDGMMFKPTQ